jgi:hypothetical protein
MIVFMSLPSFCKDLNGEKIKDVLHLTNQMGIIVTEFYYGKQETIAMKEKIEMHITVEDLQKMFLEKAVIVNGVMINYAFGYEPVVISGIIKNNGKSYKFDYNLAGFGYIFITDKNFIEYGDMSKSLSDSEINQ